MNYNLSFKWDGEKVPIARTHSVLLWNTFWFHHTTALNQTLSWRWRKNGNAGAKSGRSNLGNASTSANPVNVDSVFSSLSGDWKIQFQGNRVPSPPLMPPILLNLTIMTCNLTAATQLEFICMNVIIIIVIAHTASINKNK